MRLLRHTGENGDWVVFGNVLHAVRFVWTVCDVVQMVSGFDVFRSDNPGTPQ